MSGRTPSGRHPFEILVGVVLVSVLSTLTSCGTANTDFPAQPRLPAPENLAIQTAGLSVTISWDVVSGASSYFVYWAESSTVTTASGTRANTLGPPYVHQASTFGTTYAYLVVAVDARGSAGRASQVVTITPSGPAPQAPPNVRATAGDSQVTLDWDSVTGARGYQVEVTSQFGTSSVVPDPVAPPLVHHSLQNRTDYAYRVRGKFGTTLGPWSLPVAAIPMPITPGSPVFTDVRAQIKTNADPIGTPQGAVQLSWSKAEHAEEYQVYVKTTPDGPEQPLIDLKGFPLKETSYRHSPVAFGVSYTYRVEAINEGVTSPPINDGSGSDPLLLTPDQASAFVPSPLTPGAIYPYAIRGFDGSSESSDVLVGSVEPPEAPFARDLSWTPPSGGNAIGQRLYRAVTVAGPFELIATFADLTTFSYRDDLVSPDPVPTGLTVIQQAPDLWISWSPLSDALSGYRLYWREQAPGGAIGSEQVPTTAYRHGGRQSGSTYIYAVQVEGKAVVSPSVSGVAP